MAELIRYDEKVKKRYYMCNGCGTHLALQSNLIKKVDKLQTEDEAEACVFSAMDNIYILSASNLKDAKVWCKGCNTDLGCYLDAINNDNMPNPILKDHEDGRYMIDAEKLLLKTENELINPVTNKRTDSLRQVPLMRRSDGGASRETGGASGTDWSSY